MQSRIFRRLFIILPVTLLCAGCAADRLYTGPKLPREQLALIAVDASGGPYFEVDGMRLTSKSADVVEVRPGKHTISSIQDPRRPYARPFSLREELEAGRLYYVQFIGTEAFLKSRPQSKSLAADLNALLITTAPNR
jgi:hypothetical protein